MTSIARHLSEMIGSVMSSTISEALITRSLTDDITISEIEEASTKSIHIEAEQVVDHLGNDTSFMHG